MRVVAKLIWLSIDLTQCPPARRFSPPWSIEDIGAHLLVKAANEQKLGFFYFEEEAGEDQGRSR